MGEPSIVVTLSNPERAADPGLAELKNRRYLEALGRAGASAMPIDERTDAATRRAAFAGMQGLLITGGADVAPARYGEPAAGSHPPDPGRDDLDAAAFAAAESAGVPILGICRGLQVVNVLRGGSLAQDVAGHEGDPYPSPAAGQHEVELLPGSRLATILGRPAWLRVNSYHHQAVTAQRLAPGLR
ncbi:MAG: gamma-glutamyl-gamma-aminobutyrate hydrolase family protein, partial [Candidatus Limnocylindria bacterium]